MMRDVFILFRAVIRAVILVAVATILIAFFLPPIVHLGSFVYSFSDDLWGATLASIPNLL
jgi:hypothetical protein